MTRTETIHLLFIRLSIYQLYTVTKLARWLAGRSGRTSDFFPLQNVIQSFEILSALWLGGFKLLSSKGDVSSNRKGQ